VEVLVRRWCAERHRLVAFCREHGGGAGASALVGSAGGGRLLEELALWSRPASRGSGAPTIVLKPGGTTTFHTHARQQEFGLRVVMRGKQSTYIPQWAGMEFGLDRLVAQTNPDVVIVALGGNELAMPSPEVSRSSVAKVIKLIGDRPCVWATPLLRGPNDSRVLEAIRTESRPCRFFDSAKHAPDVPRGGDRIHPTIEGQRLWAGAIVEWLRKEHVVGPETARFALRARPADE
jgi:hypothetical protein